MNDFLHNSSKDSPLTIEEILDFNYDFISNFFVFINNSQESIPREFYNFMEVLEFEFKSKYFPKLLMPLNPTKLKDKSSKEYEIYQKNFNATRLMLPMYRYFKDNNYFLIENDGKPNSINYCKLKKLPKKEQFIQEILNQENKLGEKWVRKYLQSNLKQLQDYL